MNPSVPKYAEIVTSLKNNDILLSNYLNVKFLIVSKEVTIPNLVPNRLVSHEIIG